MFKSFVTIDGAKLAIKNETAKKQPHLLMIINKCRGEGNRTLTPITELQILSLMRTTYFATPP